MEPKKYSLSDINPKLGRFTLEATGTHEHVFRKITVFDEQWVRDVFPGKELEDFVSDGAKVNSTDISKFYFHFLVDKKPFTPREEIIVNEDTLEETKELLPAWKVFMASITNLEVLNVVRAFLTTATGSRTVFDAKIFEEKKREMGKDKNRAGAKSSTSSKVSTVGRPST